MPVDEQQAALGSSDALVDFISALATLVFDALTDDPARNRSPVEEGRIHCAFEVVGLARTKDVLAEEFVQVSELDCNALQLGDAAQGEVLLGRSHCDLKLEPAVLHDLCPV